MTNDKIQMNGKLKMTKRWISIILILAFTLQSTNAYALRSRSAKQTPVTGEIANAMHQASEGKKSNQISGAMHEAADSGVAVTAEQLHTRLAEIKKDVLAAINRSTYFEGKTLEEQLRQYKRFVKENTDISVDEKPIGVIEFNKEMLLDIRGDWLQMWGNLRKGNYRQALLDLQSLAGRIGLFSCQTCPPIVVSKFDNEGRCVSLKVNLRLTIYPTAFLTIPAIFGSFSIAGALVMATVILTFRIFLGNDYAAGHEFTHIMQYGIIRKIKNTTGVSFSEKDLRGKVLGSSVLEKEVFWVRTQPPSPEKLKEITSTFIADAEERLNQALGISGAMHEAVVAAPEQLEKTEEWSEVGQWHIVIHRVIRQAFRQGAVQQLRQEDEIVKKVKEFLEAEGLLSIPEIKEAFENLDKGLVWVVRPVWQEGLRGVRSRIMLSRFWDPLLEFGGHADLEGRGIYIIDRPGRDQGGQLVHEILAKSGFSHKTNEAIQRKYLVWQSAVKNAADGILQYWVVPQSYTPVKQISGAMHEAVDEELTDAYVKDGVAVVDRTITVKYERHIDASGARHERFQVMANAIEKISKAIKDELAAHRDQFDVLTEEAKAGLDVIIKHLVQNAVDAVYERLDHGALAKDKGAIRFRVFIDRNHNVAYVVLSDCGIGVDVKMFEDWERDFYVSLKKSSKFSFRFLGGDGVGIGETLAISLKNRFAITFISRQDGKAAYAFIQDVKGKRSIVACQKKQVGTSVVITVPLGWLKAAQASNTNEKYSMQIHREQGQYRVGELMVTQDVDGKSTASKLKGSMHEAVNTAQPDSLARSTIGVTQNAKAIPDSLVLSYSTLATKNKGLLRLIAIAIKLILENNKNAFVVLSYETESQKQLILHALEGIKDQAIRNRIYIANPEKANQFMSTMMQGGYTVRYFRTNQENKVPGTQDNILPNIKEDLITTEFEEQFKAEIEALIKA